MQLQIKTLSNEKFTIECELTDSVKSIKEKIEAATHLKDKYEANAVKLIFSGKILEDAKTLESYSINQDSFLVVVKQPSPKSSTVISTEEKELDLSLFFLASGSDINTNTNTDEVRFSFVQCNSSCSFSHL